MLECFHKSLNGWCPRGVEEAGQYWQQIGVVSTFCIHQDQSHALHEQDSAVGVPGKGGRDGSLQGS